jgi:hypothetical protein
VNDTRDGRGDVAAANRARGRRFAFDDTRSLPLNLEEVTPGWLSTALQPRFPGAVVTSVSVGDITSGTATRLRLELTYNDVGCEFGLPPTMFLKSAFHDWRAHLAQIGIYENDARFYEEVQPLVDVRSPLAFFAKWDKSIGEAGQFVLLLEDLDARGCTFGRATEPITPDKVREILAGMTGYHAPFWKGEGLQQFSWLQTPLSFDRQAGSYKRLEADVPQRLEQRGHVMPAKLRDPDRLVEAFWANMEISAERWVTFVHGDTHLGNFYFEADGSPGQLDWQIVRRASFAHDIAYVMGSALTIEDRRSSERELLGWYLERLASRGVTDLPSFDEAFDLYRQHFAYGLYCWLINPSDMQNEDVNLAHVERMSAAMVDLDSLDALGLRR